MTPIIVAYHTGGPIYDREAERLRLSLAALRLNHHIKRVEDVGSWRGNAHLRPAFLQECCRMFPGVPILSLDVDAVVHRDPWDLLGEHGSIAFHTLIHPTGKQEPLPGTLLLRPGPVVDRLLKAWIRFNSISPQANDRENFKWAVMLLQKDKDTARRVTHLPPELCWVSVFSELAYGRMSPVIEHLQVSREVKPGNVALRAARERRVAEIERQLGMR